MNTLVTNPPFGQASSAPVPAGQESSALELRGVMMDRGDYFFSLHDVASRTSQWVGLKESGQPFLVESYDPAAGSVQVKYRNQAMTLSLKRSQVMLQALPAGPVASAQAGPVPPAGVVSPANPDEATRLAQIAEEIRRRRAIRAQAANHFPQGMPNSGPGPVSPSGSGGPPPPLPTNRSTP